MMISHPVPRHVIAEVPSTRDQLARRIVVRCVCMPRSSIVAAVWCGAKKFYVCVDCTYVSSFQGNATLPTAAPCIEVPPASRPGLGMFFALLGQPPPPPPARGVLRPHDQARDESLFQGQEGHMVTVPGDDELCAFAALYAKGRSRSEIDAVTSSSLLFAAEVHFDVCDGSLTDKKRTLMDAFEIAVYGTLQCPSNPPPDSEPVLGLPRRRFSVSLDEDGDVIALDVDSVCRLSKTPVTPSNTPSNPAPVFGFPPHIVRNAVLSPRFADDDDGDVIMVPSAPKVPDDNELSAWVASHVKGQSIAEMDNTKLGMLRLAAEKHFGLAEGYLTGKKDALFKRVEAAIAFVSKAPPTKRARDLSDTTDSPDQPPVGTFSPLRFPPEYYVAPNTDSEMARGETDLFDDAKSVVQASQETIPTTQSARPRCPYVADGRSVAQDIASDDDEMPSGAPGAIAANTRVEFFARGAWHAGVVRRMFSGSGLHASRVYVESLSGDMHWVPNHSIRAINL